MNRIDTSLVIRKVSTLFAGKPSLIMEVISEALDISSLLCSSLAASLLGAEDVGTSRRSEDPYVDATVFVIFTFAFLVVLVVRSDV